MVGAPHWFVVDAQRNPQVVNLTILVKYFEYTSSEDQRADHTSCASGEANKIEQELHKPSEVILGYIG